MAADAHTGDLSMAPCRHTTETQDEGGGRGAVNPHEGYDECPGKRQRVAHLQREYVEYPRFRKEWWAYRQTYHGHVRDELVCRSLKEKSLASHPAC